MARFDYTLPWDEHGRLRPVRTRIDLEALEPDDLMARRIEASKSFYEWDLLEFIAARGPRGGIFVDVGTYIGNHAVYFGRFLADAVVCVEPDARLAPVIRRNLDVNGVHAFLLFECAAGARRQTGRLYRPEGFEGNRGATRVELLPGASAGPGAGVPVVPLDSLLQPIERRFPDCPISFLKLDVEEMEDEALRGATQLLARHRPHMAVEIRDPGKRDEVMKWLAERGYAVAGRFCATPTYYFRPVEQQPPLRPRPPLWQLRLARSWYHGRLRRLRRRAGLG